MATRNTTETVDDLADAATTAARRAGSKARNAGAEIGDTIERSTSAGAAKARRAARGAVDAYDEAADEFDARTASLEETIRRNPIAAAGAALLIGVVLGRFFL